MLKSKREMILVWIEVEAVGVKKSKRTWCKTGKEKQQKNATLWWVDVEGEGDRVKNNTWVCSLDA